MGKKIVGRIYLPKKRKSAAERNKHLKTLEKQARQLTPTEPLDDSTYKRVQYARYADDFIIGVIGSKADAEADQELTSAVFLQGSTGIGNVRHQDKGYAHRRQSQISRLRHYGIKKCRRYRRLLTEGCPSEMSDQELLNCKCLTRQKWVGKLIEYKAMKIKINENGKERFVALHRGKTGKPERY